MTAIDDAATFTSLRSFAPVSASRVDSAVTRTMVMPRASRAVANRQQWERRYRARLAITDTLVVLIICTFASLVSLQILNPYLLSVDPWILARIPLLTAFGWLAALGLLGTRDVSVFGSGALEYQRVAHATVLAFGLLAIAFVIFQWQGIRTQLFIAFPLGIVAVIASRWAWRHWLVRQRAFGEYSSRTVVVGERDDVEYVIRTLGEGRLGYLVVGAAVQDEELDSLRVDNAIYPVMRGHSWVGQAAALEADTIIVASQPNGDPDYIKQLAWQVEGTAAELVLSSRISDVAGPRMSLRPVEGLPLIHVKIPTFEGGAHVFKRGLDMLASIFGLLIFSPIMIGVMIAIKLDDGGPVFFRQRRVGRDGREFDMLKFRSMSVDAEDQLSGLMDDNEGAGLLFKMKNDPRVTRVGRILRKYSLDEVPQFINVLRGDMSMVGPRPPLPKEVTGYDGKVFRRLYIKPGITGPWQVGGRSDLSWEESVRLDLRYVENWSVIDDLIIMWRTVKVMVSPTGAY